MKDIALEQLLVVAVFLLLPLLNWILHRVQRRPGTEPPPPQPAREARRRAPLSAPRPAAPQPTRDRIQGRETPLAAARHSRFSKKLLFRTKADLRRGIVLMTILGPCRASQPEERTTGRQTTGPGDG
ncbi:MAG: hypothetical protein HY695_16490 [Deltaproteobacteria bacterium]|nr:hypothetical protein [Deltaproteobacteria bacterium]